LYIYAKAEPMKVKISKWGNSLGLRLPKAAIEATGMKVGAELDLVVEGRDLRLKFDSKIPFYRLEDLLAEMDRLGPENRPKIVDWGPDVGAEVIDDDYSRGLNPAPGGGSGVGRSEANTRTRAGRRPARRRAHGS
jgi:antitoxin MazE